MTAEVKVDSHTRLDLKLSGSTVPDCYVEIKNCTLVKDRLATFPDAKTERGQKHLKTLIKLKKAGARTLMFFVVQRSDADAFSPADAIDPEYGRLLRIAEKKGVEIIVYKTALDLNHIALDQPIPHNL